MGIKSAVRIYMDCGGQPSKERSEEIKKFSAVIVLNHFRNCPYSEVATNLFRYEFYIQRIILNEMYKTEKRALGRFLST